MELIPEVLMSDFWRVGSIILAFASVFALGYTINGLAEGITELPRHWWSTAPVLGLMTAAALAVAGRSKRKQDAGP